MLQSLLKGVLFVIVMAFYSVCVWRTVNEYFGKEFKTYIQLDPDVRQDKELRTLLDAQQHPPDATLSLPSTTLLRVITTNSAHTNNYNEPRIGPDTHSNAPQEEAKQITGDENVNDFSINVKSIKHPKSNTEETTTSHHATTMDDSHEESKAAGEDVINALQHQCLNITLKDLSSDRPPSLLSDGGGIENSDVTTGDDDGTAYTHATTFNVGGNRNESNGNATRRIITDGGYDEDRESCEQSTSTICNRNTD